MPAPMAPLIPLPESGRMDRRVRLPSRQNKNVNEVLAARIDQRGDILAAENIKAAADERKTFIRKILYRWNKSKLAVEPRLHGVIVCGSNVREMPRLQGADMGVNDLGGRERRGRSAIPKRAQPGKPGNGSNQQNGGGNRNPAPGRNTNGSRGSGRGIEIGRASCRERVEMAGEDGHAERESEQSGG